MLIVNDPIFLDVAHPQKTRFIVLVFHAVIIFGVVWTMLYVAIALVQILSGRIISAQMEKTIT